MPDPSLFPQPERVRSLRNLFLTLSWLAQKHLMHRLQEYGLTHPQFITLYALVRHPQPATMSELTEVSLQDAPTMTGIVNRLVKMELVQRARDEQDRRVVLVEATPAGQNLIQQISNHLEAEDGQGIAALSQSEMAALESILDHILNHHLTRLHNQGEAISDISKREIETFTQDPIGFIKKSSQTQPTHSETEHLL